MIINSEFTEGLLHREQAGCSCIISKRKTPNWILGMKNILYVNADGERERVEEIRFLTIIAITLLHKNNRTGHSLFLAAGLIKIL